MRTFEFEGESSCFCATVCLMMQNKNPVSNTLQVFHEQTPWYKLWDIKRHKILYVLPKTMQFRKRNYVYNKGLQQC